MHTDRGHTQPWSIPSPKLHRFKVVVSPGWPRNLLNDGGAALEFVV